MLPNHLFQGPQDAHDLLEGSMTASQSLAQITKPDTLHMNMCFCPGLQLMLVCMDGYGHKQARPWYTCHADSFVRLAVAIHVGSAYKASSNLVLLHTYSGINKLSFLYTYTASNTLIFLHTHIAINKLIFLHSQQKPDLPACFVPETSR